MKSIPRDNRSGLEWRLSPSRLVAWGALGVLLAFACFYNLENYPIIWWDEAIFSETAANLSQTGRYAFTIQSPDQLSDLDYRISVGPAVILPVALAYRLQGVNVINGRLVAVAYLLLAMLALYRVARSLCGSATALLSVVLALLGTDVLYWGRSVMGDVPALALFLCSLGCLFHGLDSDSGLSFLGGGLCLGLAFTAKEFYAAAFLPALMGLAYQERADRSRLGKRLGLFCLGLSMPLLAYLALKIAVLGSFSRAIHHFWQQKMLLRHEFFTPLTLGRFYSESFAYLLGHPLFWLGILGGYCLGQRDGLSPRFFLWLANFLLWTLIYLTAVYWYRFALPALFLACPAAAYLLRRAFARMVSVLPHRLGQSFVAVALGGFLLLWYPPAGVEVLGAMVSCRSSPPERLKAFLHDHVAVDCLIETPEYELAFLDDEHRFHLMPEFYFVESDAERVVLLNPRPTKYDFEKTGADILILGSFGKSIFRQVYPPGQVARNWKKIAQVDFYEVYVRRGREHYLARKRNPQLSRTLGPGSPKPESSPLSDVQDYPFYF